MNWHSLSHEEKVAAVVRGVARRRSADAIGKELSCSRNSIIGFAKRNGVRLMNQSDAMREALEEKRERELQSKGDVRRFYIAPGDANPWADSSVEGWGKAGKTIELPVSSMAQAV